MIFTCQLGTRRKKSGFKVINSVICRPLRFYDFAQLCLDVICKCHAQSIRIQSSYVDSAVDDESANESNDEDDESNCSTIRLLYNRPKADGRDNKA